MFPRRFVPRLFCAALLAAASGAGCAAPTRDMGAPAGPGLEAHAASEARGVSDDEVRAMLEALRGGHAPAGIDRVLAELRATAAAEIRGARAVHALRSAGELLAARFRVNHDPRDLAAASTIFEQLVRDAARPSACAARVALGDLRGRALDVAGARAAYTGYLRECADRGDAAHVQASLALLDDNRPRGELQLSRPRASPADASGARRAGPPWLRRIVIDPGHGGSDPGARGPDGTSESALTLDLARRVADRLAAALGIDVVLTRDDDVYVSLEERTERANAVNGDLLLSIHCNSSENPASHGVAMYVLDSADDRVAARVARRENGAFESDALAAPDVFRILADMRLTGSGARAAEIARGLQRALVEALSARYDNVMDLGVHAARFHVLVGARMPAVLAEVSFVSNPVEASRLAEPRYREAIADALVAGIAALR